MKPAGASERFIWLLFVLTGVVISSCLSDTARAATNLLHNGNFTMGSGDSSVDGWRTDAWIQNPGTTDYRWIPPQNGAPGEVEVFTHRDNDARWLQPVSLPAGWYYISAEISTEHVLPFFTGASISTLDNGVMSADLKGDNTWRRLGFYLKVPKGGADIDLCLRLGGYMNLTRGRALFRDARIESIASPPAGADHIYDLEAIRKSQVAGPIGHPWTLVMTFIVLGAIAVAGWRLMSLPARPETAAAADRPIKRRARA